MRILIWNTEWAKPNSKREKIIKKIVEDANADIICITEGYLDSWQDFKHVISSNEDYGYKIHQGRRKVILISKTPWSNISEASDTNIPEGRFISGTTNDMNALGVCIPWKEAHVTTGRKDRKSWEDHLSYLEGLQNILSNLIGKTLVMGDFNQRIPKKYSRKDAYNLMLKTFKDFSFETKDIIQPVDKQSIDHLCTKNIAKVLTIESIDNVQDDVRLSDHFGLIIEIDDLSTSDNIPKKEIKKRLQSTIKCNL
jgi:exonuclease III